MTRCSRVIAILVVLLALIQPARAQSESTGRAHLERGLELYRAARYADAIDEFEAGYAVLPRPAFLLNIAQSWRKLGRLDRARDYYRRYAEVTSPRDPARAQVLAAIQKIDAQLAQEAKAAPPPQTQTLPPPQPPAQTQTQTQTQTLTETQTLPPPPAHRRLGWTGLGLALAGTAALAAGATCTLLSEQLQDRYLHPSSGTQWDPQLLSRRDLDRTLGLVFLAGGGALLTVGVALAARFLPRRTHRLLRAAASPALELAF